MLESIKYYKTLRAARIAATMLRKQENITRCNVFLAIAKSKRGTMIKKRSGEFKTVPAVFIQRVQS